jgi:hypothetical protein
MKFDGEISIKKSLESTSDAEKTQTFENFVRPTVVMKSTLLSVSAKQPQNYQAIMKITFYLELQIKLLSQLINLVFPNTILATRQFNELIFASFLRRKLKNSNKYDDIGRGRTEDA